jgi:hypothetical protein
MSAAAKTKLSRPEALQVCREWLATTYSTCEWAYQHIQPRICVEELLVPRTGTTLKDYRLYTFYGVVKAINVGAAIYRRTHENAFFDAEWNEIPLTVYREKRPDPLPEKPAGLGEMIEAARRLGENLDFSRIDLYDTTHGVVLGEMSSYPSGGRSNRPTACTVFNKWLGEQWELPTGATHNISWQGRICRDWWFGAAGMGGPAGLKRH